MASSSANPAEEIVEHLLRVAQLDDRVGDRVEDGDTVQGEDRVRDDLSHRRPPYS
jgi:hypothetical protein